MDQEITSMRDSIRERLLAAGAGYVLVTYQGDGDEGGIATVLVTTGKEGDRNNLLENLEESLQSDILELMNDLIQIKHENYEDNLGGDGDIEWVLADGDFGKITLNCNTNVMHQDTEEFASWDAILGEPNAVQAEG